MRRRLSYANVTATLALVFAMSGGALAANHYLITSTKQISPKVLKKLKGKKGNTGATGPQGPSGPAGAPNPNAINATHAVTAENSDKLGGVSAGKFLQKTAQSGEIFAGQLDAKYVANDPASFAVAGGSYPVPLPEGVATPTLEYTTSTTADCPGVGEVVTPGTLCIYGYNTSNIATVATSGDFEKPNKRYGFSVDLHPGSGAASGYFLASWAYKVP